MIKVTKESLHEIDNPLSGNFTATHKRRPDRRLFAKTTNVEAKLQNNRPNPDLR